MTFYNVFFAILRIAYDPELVCDGDAWHNFSYYGCKKILLGYWLKYGNKKP